MSNTEAVENRDYVRCIFCGKATKDFHLRTCYDCENARRAIAMIGLEAARKIIDHIKREWASEIGI